jgi:hypothetical protein
VLIVTFACEVKFTFEGEVELKAEVVAVERHATDDDSILLPDVLWDLHDRDDFLWRGLFWLRLESVLECQLECLDRRVLRDVLDLDFCFVFPLGSFSCSIITHTNAFNNVPNLQERYLHFMRHKV